MKIKLDDKYTLCGDKYCCWLVETIDGENGPYDLRVSGYFSDFESLVARHIDQTLMGSEAESVKEIAKIITDLKKEIRTWGKAVKK